MNNQLFKADVEVKKAIELIKANVEEILASNSKDYYGSTFMNMTKEFLYLQQLNKHYKEVPEYEEAKLLIESIENKDKEFVEYFKQFVNEK